MVVSSLIYQKKRLIGISATVRDVVMMGLYPGKKVFSRLNAEDDKMKQALEELGISELINRQIGELSGGQQQKSIFGKSPMSGGKYISWMNRL